MATTTEDLQFLITVDSKGAVKGIKGFDDGLQGLENTSDDTSDSLGSLSKAFGKAGAGAVVLNQGIELITKAYDALIGPLAKATELFGIQEKAELKLSNALAVTSGFTQEALDGFKEFASELQGVTTIGDEATLELLALATAAGRSSEEAKNLVKVSADLASATGKGLNESFQALLTTFKGEAGELQKFAPELANITKESLKTGAAIDIMGKKFAGFAEVEAKTFAGLVTQLDNAIGDLFESVGKTIVDVFNLTENLQTRKQIIMDITQAIEDIRPAMVEVSKAISRFGSMLIKTFKEIQKGFDLAFDFDFSAAKNEFKSFTAVLNEQLSKMTEFITRVTIALNAVDFTAIVEKSQIVLSALLALASPLILKGLIAVGGAVLAWLAPLALAAAKFILVAGAVTALVAAVDIAARNVDTFISMFQDLAIEGAQAWDKFTTGMQKQMLEAIAEISQALADFAGEFSDDLAAGFQEINNQAEGSLRSVERQAATTQEVLENMKSGLTFEDVDLGFTGEVIDQAKKFMDTFNDDLALAKELAEDVGKETRDFKPPSGAKPGTTGPSGPVKDLNLFSKDFLKDFSETFGASASGFIGGIGDALGGMTNVVGQLKAVGSAIADSIIGLINFLPEMINKFADVFQALNDFPEKLIQSVRRFLSEFGRIFSETIQQIIEAIPTLLLDIITFVFEKLPQILVDLVGRLPEILIDGLLKKLPEIVTKLVKGLVDGGIPLAIELAKGLIKAAPKIALALMEFVIIELPKAIVKGIMEGVEAIAEAIKSIFTGKSIGFDTSQIEETVDNISKTMGKATEDVFAVLDFAADARGFEQAQQIADAINDSLDRLKDLWDKLLSLLKQAWMWIWDNIIMPIFNLVKKAWVWVWENVVLKIFDIVKEAWMWVHENIIQPIVGIVKAAFTWVKENILDKFWEIVTGAWLWVKENILDKIWQVVTGAWFWVKENILDKISEVVTGAWFWVKENVLDRFWNVITGAWDWVKKNVVDPLIGALGGLPSLGGGGSGGLGVKIGGLSFAEGGPVPGFGMTDSVNIKAMPGEFVMNKIGRAAIGDDALNAANRGQIATGTSGQEFNISINVMNPTSINERALANSVVSAIQERSIQGRMTMDVKGLRET